MTLIHGIERLKPWWWRLIVGLFLVGLLVLLRPHRLSPAGAVVGALAVVLCVAIIADYFLSTTPQGLPFLAGVAFFYLMAFAIQPFLVDFIWTKGSDIRTYIDSPRVLGFDTAVTGLILVGTVSLFGAFVLARRFVCIWWGERRLVPELPRQRQIWLAWACTIGHVVWVLIPAKGGLASLDKLFTPLGLLGFGLFFLLAIKKELPKIHVLLVFMVILPLRIYAGAKLGSVFMVLFIPAFIIFIYAMFNKKKFILSFVFLSIFLSIFYPFFVTYRGIMAWEGPAPSLQRRVAALGTAWHDMTTREAVTKNGETQTGFEDDKFARVFRHVARRINQAAVLAVVHDKTPGVVPYWQGKTLMQVLTSPIPRFIWPGKPTEVLGNSFAHRYGFINPSDESMSVNVPWLVEAYGNFGWSGVIGVMLLCGVFLGILDGVFNCPQGSPVDVALAGAVIFPLINQESNISLTIGGTIPFIACAVVLIKITSYRGRLVQ